MKTILILFCMEYTIYKDLSRSYFLIEIKNIPLTTSSLYDICLSASILDWIDSIDNKSGPSYFFTFQKLFHSVILSQFGRKHHWNFTVMLTLHIIYILVNTFNTAYKFISICAVWGPPGSGWEIQHYHRAEKGIYCTSASRLPNMYRDWPHLRGHLPIATLSTVCGLTYSSST